MIFENLFDIVTKEHVNIGKDQKHMHYCLYISMYDVY